VISFYRGRPENEVMGGNADKRKGLPVRAELTLPYKKKLKEGKKKTPIFMQEGKKVVHIYEDGVTSFLNRSGLPKKGEGGEERPATLLSEGRE